MSINEQPVKLIAIDQNENLYAKWDSKESEEDCVLDSKYRKYIFKKWIFIIVCCVAAFASAGLIVTIGEFKIGFIESYAIIWQHIIGIVPGDPMASLRDHVVWNLRMPRILVGLISGAGLAVAGAVMQSILKNPMADSYTTGISSGAAFGAALSIVLGINLLPGTANIVLNAFIFALVPTALIVLVSKTKRVSPTSMILAGIAVMYIFNALTTAIKLWASPDSLAAVFRWQVGTLNGASWGDVPIMLAVTLAGTILLMLMSRKINVLSSGDDSAKTLGIDASKLRIICLLLTSLMAAAIVSYTGIIGFVGLVSPHIARIFIGSDNRYLIPASLAFGATLMLISDIIGRMIISPATLEVGVVTAFIGGPIFLYLIIRSRKEAW